MNPLFSRRRKDVFTGLIILLALALVVPTTGAEKKAKELPMEKTFHAKEYTAHLRFLADDLLEGRATGTRGAAVAARYIASQFKLLGLKPISKSDGYYQTIPFEGFDTREKSLSVSFTTQTGSEPIKVIDEILLLTELPDESISIDEDLLFVGYGIEAPEYKWDDFKGTDVEGKTLVFLVNDPDLEITGFGSESLTYYGRWAYKIEMAKRKKAKGIILLHHNREATYGWTVVKNGWVTERVSFRGQDVHPLTVHGWMSHLALNRVLKGTGLDYAELKRRADSRKFKPFRLNTRLKASFQQTYRQMECANVAGIIPGTDPVLKDEVVLYVGHYDHLGIGLPDKTGDRIYNGALDNASGTSALICLARAFVQSPIKPKRTVIIMPMTGEELGLLGSLWYVNHPLVPLEKTALVINKDSMNHFGKRNGFGAFPVEYSSALDEVKTIGESMGLTLAKRGKDIGGGAFRSDHFPFAARGITALSVGLSGDYLDYTGDELRTVRQKIGPIYHQPKDEMHPLWRYDGSIQEIKLLYRLGRHWADGAKKPTLNMTGENPYLATMRWYGIKQKK